MRISTNESLFSHAQAKKFEIRKKWKTLKEQKTKNKNKQTNKQTNKTKNKVP
jgi:hypothetical protein